MDKRRLRRVAREYGVKVRFFVTDMMTVACFFKKIGRKWKHVGTLRYAKKGKRK